MTASDWISWSEAAALVGCPVPTIDWHTRTGRIEHRSRAGRRPSLKRSSVEEFAAWYHDQQDAKAKRRAGRESREELRRRHRARAAELGIRPGRIPPLEPDSTGWVTTHEAAAILGASKSTVTRFVRRGDIKAVKVGSRWWLDETGVRQLAGELARWLSYMGAATLVGCSEQTIKKAVARGLIEQRDVHRTLPSLSRPSVEAFAGDWQQRRGAVGGR